MGVSYPLSGQNKIGLREGMNRCMQNAALAYLRSDYQKLVVLRI